MQLNFVKRWSAHCFVRGAGIILGQGGRRRANLAKEKRTSKVLRWEYRVLYSSTFYNNCFSNKFCLLIACLISVLSYQRLESKFLHIKRGYFASSAPPNDIICPPLSPLSGVPALRGPCLSKRAIKGLRSKGLFKDNTTPEGWGHIFLWIGVWTFLLRTVTGGGES